jgi:hypothetical protein
VKMCRRVHGFCASSRDAGVNRRSDCCVAGSMVCVPHAGMNGSAPMDSGGCVRVVNGHRRRGAKKQRPRFGPDYCVG